ncbi:hypothetical protein BDC45DRAFT_576386 [Circinella umbellata]|nr:hypothetical protein BDC45DRAFT_576386 [Circinella umbellata]
MPADSSKKSIKSSVPTTPYPTLKDKNQKASTTAIIASTTKNNIISTRSATRAGSEPLVNSKQQSTASPTEIIALIALVEKLAKRIDKQDTEIQTRVQGQNNQIKALYDRQEEIIAQLKGQLESAEKANLELQQEVDHLKEQLASVNQQLQIPPPDHNILQHQHDLGDHMDEDARGAQASQYAHAYTPAPAPKPTLSKLAASFVTAAKKGHKKTPSKQQQKQKQKQGTTTTTTSQPSAQAIAWAKRSFQDHNGPNGYSFVYLKSNHRTKHSEVRKKLRILKVEQARVIDIQFPCKGIIGLLVHASYAPELIALLEKVNLLIIKNFDPTSSNIINYPTLQDLDPQEKNKQATQIYQKRMLRMCLNLPKAALGLAILRYFSAQEGPHNISQHNVDIFLQRKPAPTTTKKLHQ